LCARNLERSSGGDFSAAHLKVESESQAGFSKRFSVQSAIEPILMIESNVSGLFEPKKEQ